MQLTFLGTGTSTGVPMINCDCNTCRSANPRDKRLRTSVMLTHRQRQLLIDCGPDLRQQLLAYAPKQLAGCLITHSHYDHVGGIDDLRPFCYPDGFDIYCTADVVHELRAHVPYCFAEKPYPGAPVLHPHIITPMQHFEVNGLSVLPLPVNHYLIDIVGFKIGALAYITDAKTIPHTTIEAIKGVDTLVINALRRKPHISHMNLDDALNVISAVRPRVAYLTHISHDMGLHDEVQKTLPDGVYLAYDGLTVDIAD